MIGNNGRLQQMKFTLRPKTILGKVSLWGILYFFVSWILVAVIQPRFGSVGGRNFFDWILILLAISGIIGAFVSMFGGLIAIVWREDRSFLGILMFILSVPICVLLAGFILGSYIS